MSQELNMIEIDGNRYKVRKHHEVSEVCLDGVWMDRLKFVDALISLGEWGQVCELAKLGKIVVLGERDS